jgi:hypothetical protein
MQPANVAAGIRPADSRIGQAAVETNRPMAISDRVGGGPGQTVAAQRRPASSSPRPGDCRQAERQPGDYRQNELRANDSRQVDYGQNALRPNDPRQADPRQGDWRQADSRNDVGDRYRDDWRVDPRGNYRGDAAPTSPLMPDLNREFSPAGPQAPPPPAPPRDDAAGQLPPGPQEQPSQAGVARLQGAIGTPPTN